MFGGVEVAHPLRDVVAQAVGHQIVGGAEMLLGLALVAEAAWTRPVWEATSALAAGRPAFAAATPSSASGERCDAWSGRGESLLGNFVEDESVVEPDADRDAEHPSLVGGPLLFQDPHLLL